MAVTSMKQLLEAGVHFGHQTKRWNPKMAKYIYAARNDIHIIDLQISVEKVEEAYAFIRQVAQEGKDILFVGTKKQAQDAIQSEAERCGMYYINQRWLGGTLTNFKTIKSRIDRLNKLNQMEIVGEFDLLPKKEVFEKYRINQPVYARVAQVMEDGRLTLSVKKKIPEQMNDDASFIYETLQRENGFLPFNDKSDSEAVKNRFHMSKNAFKRAIGHLYKERLITIEKDGIHLN